MEYYYDRTQDIGEVKSAELHYSPSGQPKGSAEVSFVRASHAKTAIDTYNNRVLDGRPMRVFLAPADKPSIDSSDLRNRLGGGAKGAAGGGRSGVNFAVTLDGSGSIFNGGGRKTGGGGGGMLRDEFRERRGGARGAAAAAQAVSGGPKIIGVGGKNSCFECGGMGHIAVNCPNHKYKKNGGGGGGFVRAAPKKQTNGGGGGGFGGGFKNGGGGGGFKKKVDLSEDDLDKEMESYMAARNK
jgi:hypothetical protein